MTTPAVTAAPDARTPYQASTNSLTAGTQDRFLTLLMTQLRNQDPLNPLDNAQVTSQIAQLSTVNGINQLNNTLLSLSGQLDVGQSMQAANLIGKGVLVPGDKVALGADADGALVATPFGADLLKPAAKLTATVLDANGLPVRQLELGKQNAGVITLDWDGCDASGNPMPAGKYHVKLDAVDAEGEAVAVTALTYGRVESVAYTSDGLRLEMGLAGSASLLDLRKVM